MQHIWDPEEGSINSGEESGLGSDEWEGSEQYSGEEEVDPSIGPAAVGRELSGLVDGASDARANVQIRGDFDRLMEEIKTTNQGTKSLGKAWDFTIADNDADNFDLQDELRAATGIGKRNKGKGRTRGPRKVHVSQEVKYLLGQANDAYAAGDRAKAIQIFQDVITIEPGIASAWSTLALCHEEAGDTGRALQLRIMAAHLASEAETWVELGLSSRELGLMEQAVYCYRNAARLDKTNPDILWDYAFCLRESGQTQKAIKTYESILQILPHDLTILAQLRDLLVQRGDLTRAAELYSIAFEHYLSSPTTSDSAPQDDIAIDPSLAPNSESQNIQKFGTREIATLADLLSGLGEHARAVDIVMRGASWLGQTGENEDEDSLEAELDVNLRMRLAVAKLRLGDFGPGKELADRILEYDINEFYELHTELADVYFEIGVYGDAVAIYEQLACQPHTSSLHVLSQIGACYRQMKNYKAARDVYKRIIDVDPEKRLALDLVNQVIQAREQQQQLAGSSQPTAPLDTSLFIERTQPAAPPQPASAPKRPKQTITPAQAQKLERERQDVVLRGFKRLNETDAGDICLDPDAQDVGRWDEWIVAADEVANVFMSEKRLFILDRYKEFSGLRRKFSKKSTNDDEHDAGHSDRICQMLIRSGRKQNYIWLSLLTIAVVEGDTKSIVEYSRKLVTRHQFNNDALRLMLASLGGGITAAEREDDDDGEAEAALPNKNSASAVASNPCPVLPTKESPAFITAYAQISGGTKSYQTEIYYLFRAYDIEPNDPVICLSLGTACIGRAMQRQADNRNHMVAQVIEGREWAAANGRG
ncbi:TPR-2 domain protein [Ceratobasidium sp. AG-Ba]|nr:TPR-2 domain protein [Ceratobasidium sp. AG-Ba]